MPKKNTKKVAKKVAKKVTKSKNPKVAKVVRKAHPKVQRTDAQPPSLPALSEIEATNRASAASTNTAPQPPVQPTSGFGNRFPSGQNMMDLLGMFGGKPPSGVRTTTMPSPSNGARGQSISLPPELAAMLPSGAAAKVEAAVTAAVEEARSKGISSGVVMVELVPEGDETPAPSNQGRNLLEALRAAINSNPSSAPQSNRPPRAPDNAYTNLVRDIAAQQDEVGGYGGTFRDRIEEALAVEWATFSRPQG